MAENESERTTDASKDGDERLPIAGDIKKQGKPPSWNDIPKFRLGKLYAYFNLVLGILMVYAGVITGRDLVPNIVAFIVTMVLFLSLRKRKRFGLILLYIIVGLNIIVGSVNIIVGKSLFINRIFSGGLLYGIACPMFVYFYRRRQYFNR
jgi:hypothetical protein